MSRIARARKLMANHDLAQAPKAYELLRSEMERGGQEARYAIGTWHLHGFYLKKNVRKGVALIAEAADNGVADAAFDMGVSYELGVGRKADENKALCYFMRAFLLGDPDAAVEIERLLYWGSATIRNRALSREFAMMASNDR